MLFLNYSLFFFHHKHGWRCPGFSTNMSYFCRQRLSWQLHIRNVLLVSTTAVTVLLFSLVVCNSTTSRFESHKHVHVPYLLTVYFFTVLNPLITLHNTEHRLSGPFLLFFFKRISLVAVFNPAYVGQLLFWSSAYVIRMNWSKHQLDV